MKITHKLALLILLGFISNLVIAIIGLRQLAGTNEDLQYIMTNTVPSFTMLSKIDHSFLEARIAIRTRIMMKDPAQQQVLEEKYRSRLLEAQQMTDDYLKNLVSDQTDQSLIEQAQHGLKQYVEVSQKTMDLIKAGQLDAAIAALDSMAAVSTDISQTLVKDADYNRQLGDQRNTQAKENYSTARTIMMGVAFITIALLIGIGMLIYRQISTGLRNANQTIARIENTLDFTLRAEVQGNDEISVMLRAFNQLIGRMQTNLRELLAGVDRITANADRVQESARRVSDGSSSQNASTSHMAASVEEMTVSINHVADQAKTTSDQSGEVGSQAEAGQVVIGHTVDNIHAIANAVESAAKDIRQLEDKGREIESVINIIRSVAEQTNLLALNAAIEAARAGEQGRGFAVVADEVRSLASRTATSTREISDIIKAIQDVASAAVHRMQEATVKVEQGVSGAGQANDTMAEICRVASHSVSLVADISNAIREQGAATNAIAQQVENVANMVNENTEAANDTARLANELADISTEMKRIVAAYRL